MGLSKYGPRPGRKTYSERPGRSARYNRASGEVPLAQLIREVEVAHRKWCERRKIVQHWHDPVFGEKKANPVTPRDLAMVYLAMDKPPRGTLIRMVSVAGLNYRAVAVWVYRLRKGRVRT